MLVTTNYENAQNVTYDLGKLRACEGTIERWETNMDGGYKYKYFKEDGVVSDKKVSLHFAKNTIQTLEVKCAWEEKIKMLTLIGHL